MLWSYYNRKSGVPETLVCRLCKKDIEASKGQCNWFIGNIVSCDIYKRKND